MTRGRYGRDMSNAEKPFQDDLVVVTAAGAGPLP
jgi:hypothetical protein